MNIFKNVGNRFLGLPSMSQGSMSVNYLTLSFTGDMIQNEEEFQDDYFIKSLSPFRFSLILSLIFYGAFAFLALVTQRDVDGGMMSVGTLRFAASGFNASVCQWNAGCHTKGELGFQPRAGDALRHLCIRHRPL